MTPLEFGLKTMVAQSIYYHTLISPIWHFSIWIPSCLKRVQNSISQVLSIAIIKLQHLIYNSCHLIGTFYCLFITQSAHNFVDQSPFRNSVLNFDNLDSFDHIFECSGRSGFRYFQPALARNWFGAGKHAAFLIFEHRVLFSILRWFLCSISPNQLSDQNARFSFPIVFLWSFLPFLCIFWLVCQSFLLIG